MADNSERDPLQDPLPGDIVKSVNGSVRRVTYFPDPYFNKPVVRFTQGVTDDRMNLKSWRRWAKGGKVVARGE